MNKIVNHVNNLFFALPKTEENARLKDQILDSMQNKYEGYLHQGLPEDLAFGRVVAEFGQMKELLPDFDIERTASPAASPAKEPSPRLQAYMDEFQNYHGKFRLLIAFGVFCCILAPFGSGLVSSLSSSEAAVVSSFVLPVAIGVTTFIIAGMKYSSLKQMILALSRQENYLAYFEYFKDSDSLLEQNSSPSYRGYHENSYSSFSNSNNLAGRICGVIMLLATIAFLVLGIIFQMWNPGWIVFPIGALLCAIVGILSPRR